MTVDLEPGQRWAYRENKDAPVVEVEVLQLGTRRPPRVRIRHLDDRYEGREEWVPPARLKVLWEQAESWIASEQRWAAVRDASWRPYEDPELMAVELVFEQLVDAEHAQLGWNKGAGVLTVTDAASLVAQSGIDRELLTASPLAFTESDGSLVVPWDTVFEVAQVLARKSPDKLLDYIRQEEARFRIESVHGRYTSGRRDGYYIAPERCEETAAQDRKAHHIVLAWCGVEALEREDELVALRAEVRRLGHLVERAIAVLSAAGRSAAAKEMERELGVPVETLRQARLHQGRR